MLLQSGGKQSEPFYHLYIPILTTVLDHSQVVPYHKAIREPMYPSWVPRNTRLACTLGINKTNPFHSYQGWRSHEAATEARPHLAETDQRRAGVRDRDA